MVGKEIVHFIMHSRLEEGGLGNVPDQSNRVYRIFRSFTKIIKECLDFFISVKSFFGILFPKTIG